MRKRYVYDSANDRMVEVTEAPRMEKPRSGPDIMPDIEPYQSMITGETITSRSRHREHLKQHNCIEVGNEVSYMIRNRVKPEPPSGLRETLIRAAYRHKVFR